MVIPQSTRGQKKFFWDIVLNNYSLEECETVKAIFEEIGSAYIIGKEVGESGTPHLQMMIKLNKGNYKSYLKGKLGKRYSIRPGRNINALKEYCMKDGDIYAMKNVETLKLKEKLEIRVNRILQFEKQNRKNLYEKFIKEEDPNMEGYEFIKKYLYDKIDEEDRLINRSE